MKAVILNSGMGTRMGVLTKEHPKCMTEIAENETILSAQLKAIAEVGITEVLITTGYFNDVLVKYCESLKLPLEIEYVYNPLFDQTNYIYSLYCARESLRDEDIILMHGDMVFSPDLFEKIVDCPKSCMAVSSTVALPEKDFKAVLKEGKIVAVGIEFFENAVAAQPLYKLLSEDWNVWLEAIERYCESDNVKCYAENAFNEVSHQTELYPYDVEDVLCQEIDNSDDLAIVAERYQSLMQCEPPKTTGESKFSDDLPFLYEQQKERLAHEREDSAFRKAKNAFSLPIEKAAFQMAFMLVISLFRSIVFSWVNIFMFVAILVCGLVDLLYLPVYAVLYPFLCLYFAVFKSARIKRLERVLAETEKALAEKA
ncbi:MAG: phosphocholine cytidylyltransferase family protein [Clostridia bacterium]|nr:phosphocholine cytidylyltransferase family protein [Clostridia bacterium]